jgi:DNA-directed RNA polymerase subunit RPC12/RpoP
MMKCSNCDWKMEYEVGVFRGDFRCKHCGVRLFVRDLYTKFLALLSLSLSLGLIWIAHLPVVLFHALDLVGLALTVALVFPLAYVLLIINIRTVPKLIPPTLVLYRHSYIVSLDLNNEQQED